jgi:hypothetical protein
VGKKKKKTEQTPRINMASQLDPDQQAILKADILANPDPAVQQAVADGSNNVIADWYNQTASPDYWIWVTLLDLITLGNNVDGDSIATMTTGDLERVTTFWVVNPGGAIATRYDIRECFASIFSTAAGASTRARLLTVFQRLATYAEKLFAPPTSDANGTWDGTQATALDGSGPAESTWNGRLTDEDIEETLAS